MIISCLTLKGGGGKTTLAINLAVGFALKKKRVLLIDTDMQHSASSWAGVRPEERCKITVVGIPDHNQLKKQIANFSDYDIIIIDGTPAIGHMATVSAALSDLIIHPVCPSMLDLWATGAIMQRVDEVRAVADNIKIALLANKMQLRTKQAKNLIEELTDIDDYYVFKQTLGNRVSYSDSIAEGLGVLEWSDSQAKSEIDNVIKEITKLMKG